MQHTSELARKQKNGLRGCELKNELNLIDRELHEKSRSQKFRAEIREVDSKLKMHVDCKLTKL